MEKLKQNDSLAGIDYYAFQDLYTSVSPALFGIIMRIVDDPSLADYVLLDVFIYLNDSGQLKTGLPCFTAILPVIFYCSEKALSGTLSDLEIQDRIDTEKQRMLQAINRKTHLVTGYIKA